MTALNKQALRVLAVALDGEDWHTEGNSVYGGRYDVGDNVCYDHIASCESVNGESPHADFIAAANPATVLALLDELEAAEKRIAELRDWNAGLAQESFTYQQKVAELEARTVTLPYLPDDCDRTEAHFKYQAAIAAAGIGVKGE